MTRVSSQRTRQALLAVGTEIDPFELPERWELYNLDGTPFDSIKDLSRLRWAGDWDAIVAYSRNDVVRHNGALYVAPDTIPVGTEPGLTIADPNVGTPNRGVQFKQSDRVQSTIPRTITIGDPPGQRRDNDISPGYSAAILVDKTGATSGLTVIITPLSVSGGTGNMSVARYDAGAGLMDVTNWSAAEVAAHTTKAIAINDNATDYYLHLYFGGGVDGSFEVSVNSSANLASPPTADIVWETLVNAFEIAMAVPTGGTTGQVLGKLSSSDRDVGWGAIPHELPAGGANTYILAKASGSDYDVQWVTSPRDPAAIDRRDTSLTTASLVAATDTGDPNTRLAGGGESGTWVIGPGTLLTKIVVNRPCRVRLYTSAAKRTADLARDRFTDPTGDHGCLAEFLLISTLSMDNIPADYLASGNADSNIFYRIENYDTSAGTITVTLTVKDVEL